jgi:thiosulfate reductase cytochrome b subunit
MGRRLHPWPLRIMHWVNAVVMLIMITSGWGIYDDDVIIRGFHFSSFWRLGDWAAWSLNWHFAGMWFLVINGLIYLAYGFASGRFREKLLPIRPTEVMQTVIDTLHFRIAHEDITVYNAVQKLLYIIVILAGISQVITGLAIWKPVQFSGLVSLLGGFQTARVLHFAGMAVIVGFLIVHVALALLVPKTLWAMIAGGPWLKPRGRAKEGHAAGPASLLAGPRQMRFMAGAKSVPEVCRHLQRLGDYLRWGSSLAPALLAVDDLGCRDSGVRILILSPYPLVVGGGINVGLYGSAQGAARRWDQRFESALLQRRVLCEPIRTRCRPRRLPLSSIPIANDAGPEGRNAASAFR